MAADTVSVIVPVYNGERYLREAIDSVLGQTRIADEIIAVDDGSTDGTARIVLSYGSRVRYIRQENQGAGAAFNMGIRHAAGSLLGFIGADDLWSPRKLELQSRAFQGQPEVDMVFGYTENFITPELDAAARARLRASETPEPGYHQGCMLIKRISLDQVGLMVTQYTVGEFVDWYARAREAGLKSVMLQDVVYRRRLHASNLGVREKDARQDYAHILKASLDRKRRRAGKAP